MYIYIYIFVYMFMYIYIYVHVYIYIYVYVCLDIYKYMCLCLFIDQVPDRMPDTVSEYTYVNIVPKIISIHVSDNMWEWICVRSTVGIPLRLNVKYLLPDKLSEGMSE